LGRWMAANARRQASSKSGKVHHGGTEAQRKALVRFARRPGRMTVRSTPSCRFSVSLCLCGADPCLRRRERPLASISGCRKGGSAKLSMNAIRGCAGRPGRDGLCPRGGGEAAVVAVRRQEPVQRGALQLDHIAGRQQVVPGVRWGGGAGRGRGSSSPDKNPVQRETVPPDRVAGGQRVFSTARHDGTAGQGRGSSSPDKNPVQREAVRSGRLACGQRVVLGVRQGGATGQGRGSSRVDKNPV